MFGKKVKKAILLPYFNELFEYIRKRESRKKCTLGEKEALGEIRIILDNMLKEINEG